MRPILTFVRRRVLDLLTLAALVLAGYLFLQPGSAVRIAWAGYQSESHAKRAAERLWPALAQRTARLYADSATPEVIEISDYTCPFCRRVDPTVDSALAVGARVAYLHMPNPARPHAEAAARAALCAESSGDFRRMHTQLMGSTEWQRDSNWVREAQAAGVTDLARFHDCLDSPSTHAALAKHRALAESLAVDVTPAFVSPRHFHRGTLPLRTLLEFRGER